MSPFKAEIRSSFPPISSSSTAWCIDPASIHEVEVLLTLFDGRVVYRSEKGLE